MARGWTPGLLPLHLGWGTSPKERREGGEGGEVSRKESEAATCPHHRQALGWGMGEISDLAAPLRKTIYRESVSSVCKLGAKIWMPVLPADNRCLWSWGGLGQRGKLPAELGVGRGVPAWLVTSWQEG